MVRERIDHMPYWQRLEKMKSLMLQIHGCLAGDVLSSNDAQTIIEIWLKFDFELYIWFLMANLQSTCQGLWLL